MIVAWSGGKDSAWALARLRADPSIEVLALFTTVRADDERVVMHGTSRALLHAQADALGLPLWEAALPNPCPNEVYEASMAAVVDRARSVGADAFAFGDLFLEDIRAYRERMLAGTGLRALFPLWGEATGPLASAMIDGGLRALLVAVDPSRLAPDFLGRGFDRELLAELPEGVDPCGERGEFHTLVIDGPGFRGPLAVATDGVVHHGGHAYADVRLIDGG
ncbi:MAG: ATP-binding protein [Nannocystaceae bacterium]